MRASPVAIARAFMQSRGRGKGKKASVVRLETRSTTVHHPSYGALEAELLGGGKATLLMQIVFMEKGDVGFVGGDHEDPQSFLKLARCILSDQVCIIEKKRTATGTVFEATKLAWQRNSYQVIDKEALSSAPSGCIWRELLPGANGSASRRYPVFYKRGQGQFVFRVAEGADITELALQARRMAWFGLQDGFPPYVPLENPQVSVAMSMDLRAFDRVLGKISFNVMTYLCGDTYVRHTAFDPVRKAIRTGRSEVFYRRFPEERVPEILNGVPRDCHAVVLSAVRQQDSTYMIGAILLLYGVAYFVELARAAPTPPDKIKEFLVIEFTQHRIENLNSFEFIKKYPPHLTLL